MKQDIVTLEQLMEAGAHFGHQTHRWNPKMASYIYGKQGGVHIFDLAKTREMLSDAIEFLANASKEGKSILFVGTKKQAKDIVKKVAIETGNPYVAERWLGGTLTNFNQISKSVKDLFELKGKIETGNLAGYTKKEKLLMRRNVAKMEIVLEGLANMKKLPDILFVIDTHKEKTAVAEAIRLNIPVVGVVDSNSDPTIISHVIPMNDDAVAAVDLVMSKVAGVLKPEKTDSDKKTKIKSVKVKGEEEVNVAD